MITCINCKKHLSKRYKNYCSGKCRTALPPGIVKLCIENDIIPSINNFIELLAMVKAEGLGTKLDVVIRLGTREQTLNKWLVKYNIDFHNLGKELHTHSL